MICIAQVIRHDTFSKMLEPLVYCCTSLVVRIFVFTPRIAVDRQSGMTEEKNCEN